MTKRNVVWLITKLIGVYFAYWTVVAVFVLIGSIYAYISLPSPPRFPKASDNANAQTVAPVIPGVVPANPANPANPTNPAVSVTPTTTKAQTAEEKAKSDALKELLWNLVVAVLSGLVAWYLIRDGRFLFAVLNREEPFDESGKPLEADAFPLSKKKEEVVTSLNISGHPSRKSEAITALDLSGRPSEPAAQAALTDSTVSTAAAEQPVEVLPATPSDEPESAPPVPSPPPAATTVTGEARANPQTFVPDALTNQPVFYPEPAADRSAAPADDGLIDEFNINPPGERK